MAADAASIATYGELIAVSRSRIMDEMLGGVVKSSGGWSVLVMDEVTTRMVSSLVGISDILDFGVSLVEDIHSKREPFPLMTGVYLISPTESSVDALLADFSNPAKPQYKAAHVFFSSQVSPSILAKIKASQSLVKYLGSLKEFNLEYVTVDRRVVVTNQESALHDIFGDGAGGSSARAAISTCVRRLATLFATLKEMPAIRYRANVPGAEQVDTLPDMDARRMVPQTVAKELYAILGDMQKSEKLPSSETCDLIIVDRGYDVLAPLIHEWTYEAMLFDLLPPDAFKGGKVYMREAETQGGKTVRKEHPLDESDKMWQQVRHAHFAVASRKIAAAFDDFRAKSKAKMGARGDQLGAMETSQIRKMMQNLPQYLDLGTQVATHVEIASRLNALITRDSLTAVGQLEQETVFGESSSKDVAAFFQERGATLPSHINARLLACFLATNTERLDAETEAQWARATGVTAAQLRAIENLEYLGVPVFRRAKGMGRLRAGFQQLAGKKRRVRKDRDEGYEDEYNLSKFQPLMADLLEDCAAGKLSSSEYPNIAGTAAAEGPARPGVRAGNSVVGGRGAGRVAGSASGGNVLMGRGRGERPAWAARRPTATSMDSSDSSGHGRAKARKVFVFVIGGVTRSEMRTAHVLSGKLGRDVYLASTSLETPASFLDKLARVGGHRFQL